MDWQSWKRQGSLGYDETGQSWTRRDARVKVRSDEVRRGSLCSARKDEPCRGVQWQSRQRVVGEPRNGRARLSSRGSDEEQTGASPRGQAVMETPGPERHRLMWLVRQDTLGETCSSTVQRGSVWDDEAVEESHGSSWNGVEWHGSLGVASRG